MKGKYNRWVYVGLGLMLFALVCFSMAPLVSSVLQARQSHSGNSTLSPLKQLDSQALGYEMVLEREPENQTALFGLLEIRLKQGNLQGALKPLEKLAQLNPQQTDYQILLAQTQAQLQDYPGAITTYKTLLNSHPGNIIALKGLVDLFLSQNQSEQAIEFVQATLKQGFSAHSGASSLPESIDLTSVGLLLGEIYIQQKQYPEAIAVYQQVSKADQEDFRPLLAQALALKQQGKETEAQPLFQQAINLAPVQYKDEIKKISLNSGAKSAIEPEKTVTVPN